MVKQEEIGLSIDWVDTHERCWRCGYKKPLERCHIIPDSLGEKDEVNPNNNKVSDYNIEIGINIEDAKKLIKKETENYKICETGKKQEFVITNNPIHEIEFKRDNEN